MNIILYNFNNIIDLKDKELTYEFFDEQLDKNYEICAYDKIRLTKKKLINYLRILKCTRN